MTNSNPAAQTRRELEACQGPASPDDAASQGLTDALDLITDIRDLDPRQVYGRLQIWMADDPHRLLAATVVLAAWADPNVSAKQALAWTDGLVSWRGVA